MNTLSRLTSFLALGTLLWLYPVIASACGCTNELSVAERVKAEMKRPSTVIFSGEVVSVKAVTQAGIHRRQVLFHIDQTWKKQRPRATVVETGTSSGDCGYDFRVGARYLVYPDGHSSLDSSILTVDQCSLTKPLQEAGIDLRILGSGIPAIGQSSGRPKRNVMVLVSLALFTTGAVILYLRHLQANSPNA